jgi:phospholipid/cholesterol/gamma-HCH transport system permease protein
VVEWRFGRNDRTDGIMDDQGKASFDFQQEDDSRVRLVFAGRLDRDAAASIWSEATSRLRHSRARQAVVQAGDIDYCDGAGIALLVALTNIQREHGGQIEIKDLAPQFGQLMVLFETDYLVAPPKRPGHVTEFVGNVGKHAIGGARGFAEVVSFVGEVFVKLFRTALNLTSLRWRDTLLIAEKAGANAVNITALLGFLIGLILAFQAAVAMRKFGAEVFVADLVVISLFRELGPLITAFILASRSGSAFAAELGTMKVNEEVDALVTMGLDPVGFLVLPRVVAAVCMTPLLTMFNLFFGLAGCALVMISLGIPIATFFERIKEAASLTDFFGGFVKTFVFGALVAGIGCLRGLQTDTGPSAVGDSATRAVVSGIVAVVVADGVFAVTYYFLGI